MPPSSPAASDGPGVRQAQRLRCQAPGSPAPTRAGSERPRDGSAHRAWRRRRAGRRSGLPEVVGPSAAARRGPQGRATSTTERQQERHRVKDRAALPGGPAAVTMRPPSSRPTTWLARVQRPGQHRSRPWPRAGSTRTVRGWWRTERRRRPESGTRQEAAARTAAPSGEGSAFATRASTAMMTGPARGRRRASEAATREAGRREEPSSAAPEEPGDEGDSERRRSAEGADPVRFEHEQRQRDPRDLVAGVAGDLRRDDAAELAHRQRRRPAPSTPAPRDRRGAARRADSTAHRVEHLLDHGPGLVGTPGGSPPPALRSRPEA